MKTTKQASEAGTSDTNIGRQGIKSLLFKITVIEKLGSLIISNKKEMDKNRWVFKQG